jgi:gliding motility-associated-like protein
LYNSTTLNPLAGPVSTTKYLLTVLDTLGCPKPLTDTVVVKVIPIVVVNAGHDTSVVANQPLQLNASSSADSSTTSFLWKPATWLNNSFIYNPIATINNSVDSIKYTVRATTPEGCFGEDDIVVKVFKTEPDIFVPSGFTPNSDGRNDVLIPIPVGINKLDFFSVYNRWGQLLYSSPEIGKGWDGNFAGSAQPSGTYVYMVQGTSYLGKVIFKKGTAVLIR